jgi:hypothetical protein
VVKNKVLDRSPIGVLIRSRAYSSESQTDRTMSRKLRSGKGEEGHIEQVIERIVKGMRNEEYCAMEN